MINPDSPEVQEILDAEEALSWKIDKLLEHGLSKRQLLALNFKEATIRQRINKFKEAGKEVADSGPREAGMVQVPYVPPVLKSSEHVSPVWMAQRLATVVDGDARLQSLIEFLLVYPLYQEDLMTQVFKRNLMAVTAIKGDQTKELIAQMQLGAQQASDAAHDAAMETAALMAAGQKDAALAGNPNPMAAMMSQTMMPFIQNMMSRVMGGAMGATPAGTIPAQIAPAAGSMPSGWTQRSEPSKEKETTKEEPKVRMEE